MERPYPALPFTVVEGRNVVHLIAGEDVRYALRGEGLESWAPELIAACDGSRTVDMLLELVEPDRRGAARRLLERLAAERVLVEGPPEAAHEPVAGPMIVAGTGPIAEALRTDPSAPSDPDVAETAVLVFCQDALDLEAARDFNRLRLGDGRPWLWATTGPMARGFVGPLFRPGVGPCLACLLSRFRSLSPTPEIYDCLLDHTAGGGSVTPVPFDAAAAGILASIVRWKHAQSAAHAAPVGLYRLHVLEVASLEVSTHVVIRDAECGECGDVPGT